MVDTNCHHWMMTIDDNCQGAVFIRGHGRTGPAAILVPMSPVLLLFQPMSNFFINLQLFFSCIDNIYLCQSSDESTNNSWALQKFYVSIYQIPPCLKFPLDIRDESCPTRLTTLSARMALMSREGVGGLVTGEEG